MSSRTILGFASVAGLVLSMAVPAFAQTTTTQTTPTTTNTMQNCPPGTTATTNTAAASTPTSGNGTVAPDASQNNVGASTEGAKGNTTNGTGPGIRAKPKPQTSTGTTTNCTTTTTPMQNTAPAMPTTSTSNYDALNNNPNGPDWLAKFNRPNVRSSNYLGTTTRPSSMRRMHMMRCHYVKQNGVKTRVCR